MIASGQMPRSPVWLRKIPSTVSGSQGSRRGLRPAVRFAFPLGARLNTTLRARPCQELFSESFSRPSRGPRGAPPSGLRPFAAASSVLYAPPARRVRETRPHTGCRQLQRGGARADGGFGRLGGMRAGASPCRRLSPVRFRQASRGGGVASRKKNGRLRARPPSARAIPSAIAPGRFSLYIYRDMFSSDCRRCAWSSLPNAATRPWERPSLQACSRSSP